MNTLICVPVIILTTHTSCESANHMERILKWSREIKRTKPMSSERKLSDA